MHVYVCVYYIYIYMYVYIYIQIYIYIYIYISVAGISRQSARTHIIRVWTLFRAITHQWREYTSADANPNEDAVL